MPKIIWKDLALHKIKVEENKIMQKMSNASGGPVRFIFLHLFAQFLIKKEKKSVYIKFLSFNLNHQ